MLHVGLIVSCGSSLIPQVMQTVQQRHPGCRSHSFLLLHYLFDRTCLRATQCVCNTGH
jgi:hypothetical protein